MKTYLYLSDIHSNFEALKHLDSLPEMQNPDCEIRFGGDYIDGVDLEPNAVINSSAQVEMNNRFYKVLYEKRRKKN